MQIDFSLEQLGHLDRAIQQLPFYIAAPLIEHINKEIRKQQEIMDTPVSIHPAGANDIQSMGQSA
jgi:hypothetical protein